MSHSIDTQPTPFYESRDHTSRDEVAFDFATEMEQLGLRATVLEAGAEDVPEGVKSLTLIEHDMPQDEPLVRLYRGISPLNGALIAHQVPSILKKIPALGAKPFLSSGGFKVEHEATLAAAEAFAENPSYDNMMALVRVTHDEPDRYFIDHRIDRIQQNMLRRPDLSLVDCLRREHIASPADSPYSGADLSPFMATANTPEFAAGFGDTLMVLDVPLSRISLAGEYFSDGDEEILVAGAIEPAWITAVARFKKYYADNRETAKKVAELIPGTFIDTDTANGSEFYKKSQASRAADIISINRERTELLLDVLGDDREMLASELADNGVASYQDALWYCARYYNDKFNELYPKADRQELVFIADEINDDERFNKPYVLTPEKVQELARLYRHHRTRKELKAAIEL